MIMRLVIDPISAEVPCFQCGYDLRGHGHEGKCPECGTSVVESRRLAALPRRPAWGDSDPAWRRRMLAGVWVLVLLPLMDVLNTLGWASSMPVPHVFGFCDPANMLDGRLISFYDFYPSLMFCMGMALLFSKERGRRWSRLDWIPRWGVIFCYAVLLLFAASFLFVAAQTTIGIAALFNSIALRYQPAPIDNLVWICRAYLHYGPVPRFGAFGIQIVFAAIAVLLGCVPLFNALRSCGSKLFGAVLLAPLILCSSIQIVQGLRSYAGDVQYGEVNIFFCSVYFWPEAFLRNFADPSVLLYTGDPPMIGSVAEAIKWSILLTIALWLSVAQVVAWWRRRKLAMPKRGADARRFRAAGE
jgi:hypothetical protein